MCFQEYSLIARLDSKHSYDSIGISKSIKKKEKRIEISEPEKQYS